MFSVRSRVLTMTIAIMLVLGVVAAPGPSALAAEADADWSFRTETPNSIWSDGGSWAIGTDILVLVNDDVSGPEFATTVQVEQTGPNPEDVGWWVNTGDFEIEATDRVTVDDGAFIKNLDVLDLTIDDINMTDDTISGTAPADTTFPVHATDGVTDANLEVTSSSGGAWTADFAGSFDIRPGTWGSAAIFDLENDATHRGWHIQMPELNVTPYNDTVDGYYFPMGATVTVEIDDPTNGAGVDWNDSGVAELPPWGADHSYVTFSPGDDGFDVAGGQVVTMSDGTTTKILVVSPLAITEIDDDDDLVHGMATPDGTLRLWLSDGQDPGRDIPVAGDGTWTADYKVAVGDSGIHDIGPGDAFDANEYDDDGDVTHAYLHLPNPQFSVETPNQVWSHGDGWIAGRTVTITVDDDDDLLNGVLHETTAPVTAWGPSPWEVGWSTNTGSFEILPTHMVTVDDGVDITRTLDVVALEVTDVDETSDTITGIAPANAWVDANAGNELENANRRVQADSGGNFTVDFGNPGAEPWEQDTMDLQPGVGGSAQVFEADGDSTHRGWRVADPRFGVDVIHEELWAYDWPIGATLDFEVFEPGDLVNPVWEDSTTVVETTWGQTEAGYRFWGDFDVHGGQVISITDGAMTRELIVSTLEVTGVDPDNDTYTGTVDPSVEYDRTHEVCAWARDLADDQHGVELCTLPSASGNWTIDFTGVGEIFPGEHTGAYQNDPDGDQTTYSWHVPPWLYVEIGDDTNPLFPDRIHLDQWVFPVDVTNGTDTVTVSDTDGDGWEVIEFNVTPGETITATGDDGRIKSLYLEELSVDTVTLWNEDPPSTVYGSTTATYEGNVQVTASADYGWWTERWVDALGGSYEADFANPGNGWREQELGYFGQGGADDVYSGGEIRAHIWDADNDQVQAIWHASNPRIIIVRGNDRIEAIDFPLGEPLTIELDDPNTPELDFTETGTVAINPDKPWETLLVFELGDYTVPNEATVTAIDDEGTPIVETEVIPFTIDLVDPDAETITGTAPEGSEVLVEADGNWRYPIADDTNTWVADFSAPGDQPGEENPVNIGPGSSGGATLLAEGGSATTVLWSLSSAAFSVDPEHEHVWGWEFAQNSSVTITIGGAGYGPFSTDEWGNFDTYFDPDVVDIVAGVEVKVSDGETEKRHTVTGLGITGIDEALDRVSGVAESGSTINVWVNDTGAWQDVTAVGGAWLADFAGEADIGPGSNGGAQQWDADGDSTHLGWWVADPAFSLNPWEGWIWGSGWQGIPSLTIATDAGVLASDVPVDSDGNWGVPPLDPADVGPGTLVTVSGGSLAKTLLVEYLTVEDIDAAARSVVGTADPMDQVQVNYDEEGAHFDLAVEADENGDWTVDFSGLLEEFTPSAWISAEIFDDDNDSTNVGVGVPNPSFSVETPFWVWSHGEGWVEDRTVTLIIDVDDNPDNGILYTDTTTIERWSPEPGDVGWNFELEDVFEIEVGHFVSVDDGVEVFKHLWVEEIEITDIDEDLDVIEGTATPFARVEVNAGNEDYEAYRSVDADSDGFWMADFANPGDEGHEGDIFDVEIETGGAAQIFDEDGDSSHRGWYLEEPPEPSFFVRPDGDEIWGGEWFGGDEVTITIDADDDPAVVLHEVVFATEDGEFYEGIDFDILPGHYVVVTDGEFTKDHWVTELIITEVDADADLVHGKAEPGTEVFVGSSFPAMIWEHLNFQFGPDNRNPDSMNAYPEFRRAVAHAVDRDLLVAEIPGAGYAIDSYVDAFKPELSQDAWSQYPYDPAAAATLIDGLCTDLGRDCVANPPVATLTTSSDSEDRQIMADLLVPMFAAAGIELQLDLEPSFDFFFGGTLEIGTFDVGEWAWVGANHLPRLVAAHWLFDPEERFEPNYYNWGTPDSSVVDANTARFAELIGLMDGTDDWALIETYIAEAEQILADQAVMIPLYVREEGYELDGPLRVVTADANGDWTADFSVPWEDQDRLDIGPGVGGYAEQGDDDGDATHAGWSGEVPINEPPEGTVEPTSQSVFYGDTIEPFVISVTDVDSSLVDVSADLPDGLELFGAPCSGGGSVECTLTVEGVAKLAAGEHNFDVVLDDGEDTLTLTMTIRVISEFDELQDIRSELKSLMDSGAFSGWGQVRATLARISIDRAAKHWHWNSDGQPTRSWVFSMLSAAVYQLTKIDADDTSQPEAVADLANRIVDLTRRCAVYAIDQAVQADGSQWWIDRALVQLQKGDSKRAAGKLHKAVRNYRSAWRYAKNAMR